MIKEIKFLSTFKKPKTILLIILIISFFGFVKLSELRSDGFYGLFVSKEEKYFYLKLKEFMESGKESIPLKELTNFEWDEMCIVNPYGGLNSDKLIYKLDRSLPNSNDEGKMALVFFRKKDLSGTVIVNIRTSEYRINYSNKNNNLCMMKANIFFDLIDRKFLLTNN